MALQAEVISGSIECEVLCKLSAPVWLLFEPVGRWFESRDSRVRLLSSEGAACPEGSSSESDEEGGSGEEVNPLLLDPTQWRDQDHYAVLGLGKLRYQATAQDIRKAYRQKVLQHHPDKQQASGGGAVGGAGGGETGDDFFKCIKIANDILSDPKRRRAYDSVDPTFDDTVPPVSAHSRENFYDVFGVIFEENMRWSMRRPVPRLGDANSTLKEVDDFYSFWYDFESWREFSYLDENNAQAAESREERRWLEKQNKAARQKMKREDASRLRALVDNAYACDPRVRQFKEAEKAEKLAKKRAREEAVRLEAMEREKEQQKRLEEERLQKEKEEEEARAKAAQAKKEKEVVKKALRKERKTFRAACKAHGYFTKDESEVVGRMQEMEKLCEVLPVDRLQELNEQFSRLSVDEARVLFEEEVSAQRKLEAEQLAAAKAKASQPLPSAQSHGAGEKGGVWTREEVQLLVKAVALYPAGTVRRWETMAQFVNSHSPEVCQEKTAKQVVSKVKALQRLDSSEREVENKLAFSKFEKQHVERGHVEATPTERYDSVKPWTAEEQKLLEAALRTYPASTTERWVRIAEAVPSRTKAECITRFKELVSRIKAKKQQT